MKAVILATIVAYLGKQEGTVLKVMCDLVHKVVLWTEIHPVNLIARYISGKKNILVSQQTRPNQVPTTEWSLPRILDAACKVFGRPHVERLFMFSSIQTLFERVVDKRLPSGLQL